MSGLPFCYKNFNLSLFNLDWCASRKCWSKPSYKLDKWKREYRWLKEKPFCRDDIGMWNVNRCKHLILIRQGLQYLLFVIRSNYVGPFFDETKKGLLWQQAWQNKDSSLSKVPSTGLDFATLYRKRWRLHMSDMSPPPPFFFSLHDISQMLMLVAQNKQSYQLNVLYPWIKTLNMRAISFPWKRSFSCTFDLNVIKGPSFCCSTNRAS